MKERLAQARTTFGALLLAFRIMAFERCRAAGTVVGAAFTLPFVLVAFTVSAMAGAVVVVVAVAGTVLLTRRFCRNRAWLVRPGDTVEYAVVGDADGFRQRFERGTVVERMDTETLRRTGRYDETLMAGQNTFFLVAAKEGVRVVALEWITGIEIGPDME
jgi:hypothetical protein